MYPSTSSIVVVLAFPAARVLADRGDSFLHGCLIRFQAGSKIGEKRRRPVTGAGNSCPYLQPSAAIDAFRCRRCGQETSQRGVHQSR